MADVTNISGRINSISQEGVAVVASQTLDERKNKKQSVINQENDEALANHGERIGTLEVAVGEGGSVDERIAQSKSEAESDIKGGASEDYDTLKKAEDAIKSEVNAREGAVSDEASARQDAINTAKTEIIGGASTDCNTLGKAEIKISTNAQDIAQLQAAYEALTESDVVIVAPTDTWPVANPQQNTIYRVADRVNPTPQYYEDYMYNGTAMVLMARYNNAIDPRPKKGSQNLVSSGGVFDNMGALDVSELNATENPHTLAIYADLSAALATIPSDYQKGGMSVKFVCSSDNKYVQYRLTADEWSTNTDDWAIADEGVYVENPEFVYVKTDKNDKILWAIKIDGGIYYGAGVPQQVIDYINEKIAELSLDEYEDIVAFLNDLEKGDKTLQSLLDEKVDKEEGKSLIPTQYIQEIENPEFIAAYLDNDYKILFAIKKNADIYFGYGCPEQIKNYVENYINTGGNSIRKYLDATFGKYIEDPENRIEIKTDSDDKIISYRKGDGTLVENVGIEINHLELTEQGMDDFQQALKDAGFQPGGGGDWSDKEVVEVPHPTRYAILNFHIGQLPKYDGEVKEGHAEYYDGLGNYFKKAVKLETQGQSSSNFARTGNRGNYTLDIDDGSEIKFGSWVPQDSFHLKGTPKDVTHGILATSYKWAYIFMEYLDAKPNRVLLKDNSEITTTNASGDRFTDWIDDARCLPDGFPVEIYVEGEYWGLYALQLKKHRKNYSIKKSDYTSLFIDADNLLDSDYQHGFWLDGVDSAPAGTTGKTWWNYFDIKGPKDLVCMDGSAFDGDNPKELIDNTSPVYDSSNKKHKGSAQAKAIIRGFSTKYLEVKELIDNNNIEGAKAKFNENFDYNACMLVYIFNCLMKNGDSIKKNTLWGTWKDGKIAPMLWDIDGVYGTDWWGGTCATPGTGMWAGGYATSAWPLSFMWTLYQDEIKATYAELRSHGIIDMNTWKGIVFGWANQIGTEAFDRDIERWPEMPSYRENYTNTEYWQEYGSSSAYSTYPTWNENTSYSVGDVVVIKIHPSVNWYLRYRAVQASDAQNPQPPVTKLYDACPQVGGYYDSPRRMEKWMEEQIRLCDIVMEYNQ